MSNESKQCEGLWDHTIDKLVTVFSTAHEIHKECPKCGYRETLPRSDSKVYFVNNLVVQKKKWSSDDNRKELLQPMNSDGSVNDDFTEAYGYNPFDKRTESATPDVQKGIHRSQSDSKNSAQGATA